jgi:hypothetical protein
VRRLAPQQCTSGAVDLLCARGEGSVGVPDSDDLATRNNDRPSLRDPLAIEYAHTTEDERAGVGLSWNPWNRECQKQERC